MISSSMHLLTSVFPRNIVFTSLQREQILGRFSDTLGRFSFISSSMHLLTNVFPRNTVFTSLQREQILGRFSYTLGRFSFISSSMHLLTSVFPRNIVFTSLQGEQTLGRFSYTLGRFSFISSSMHLLTSVFPRNIVFTSLQREQTLGRFSYTLGRFSFISSSMHLLTSVFPRNIVFTSLKQECIPVGCVPSTALAVCWGGGGCLPFWGISAWGCIPACTEADTPPVDRITDRCKNITLRTVTSRSKIKRIKRRLRLSEYNLCRTTREFGHARFCSEQWASIRLTFTPSFHDSLNGLKR